jgi:hypothetical protein
MCVELISLIFKTVFAKEVVVVNCLLYVITPFVSVKSWTLFESITAINVLTDDIFKCYI